MPTHHELPLACRNIMQKEFLLQLKVFLPAGRLKSAMSRCNMGDHFPLFQSSETKILLCKQTLLINFAFIKNFNLLVKILTFFSNPCLLYKTNIYTVSSYDRKKGKGLAKSDFFGLAVPQEVKNSKKNKRLLKQKLVAGCV